jgi:hypothetical protein
MGKIGSFQVPQLGTWRKEKEKRARARIKIRIREED